MPASRGKRFGLGGAGNEALPFWTLAQIEFELFFPVKRFGWNGFLHLEKNPPAGNEALRGFEIIIGPGPKARRGALQSVGRGPHSPGSSFFREALRPEGSASLGRDFSEGSASVGTVSPTRIGFELIFLGEALRSSTALRWQKAFRREALRLGEPLGTKRFLLLAQLGRGPVHAGFPGEALRGLEIIASPGSAARNEALRSVGLAGAWACPCQLPKGSASRRGQKKSAPGLRPKRFLKKA